jgi:hypothetical protein
MMKFIKILLIALLPSFAIAQVSIGIYPQVTASGTNTYTATISSPSAITAYTTGSRYQVKFTNANTGASTLNINSIGAKSIVKAGSAALTGGDIAAGEIRILIYDGTNLQLQGSALKEYAFACSDLTTALTTGTSKGYITIPQGFTVVGVYATLLTAQTAGSILTIDINESGTTILSTKLTIDNNETTSATAAASYVISDSSIAANAPITADIDQVGTSPAGLIVWLLGYFR